MSSLLNYACIGAGGIADKKHLCEYAKLKEVKLAAICDTNVASAQKLAEKYGIPKVYESYHQMLEKEKLDLVSICTPNFLHAPITISALRKGIHVHCEKPLALNTSEIDTILAEKNKAGKKVLVALNNRYTPESSFVRAYIESGHLGDIYHAKCGWRRRNGIPGKGVWFTDRQCSGGGSLIDLGVHFLDLVMSFMDYPGIEAVNAASYSIFGNSNNRLRPGYKCHGDGKFDVEDMATGFIRTTGNATLQFEFSWASNIEKETKFYELLGTKGGVSFSDGVLKVFSEVNGYSVDISPNLSAGPKLVNEFEHFVHCIIDDEEPMTNVEQARALMEMIDALYLSAEKRKEIQLAKPNTKKIPG